MLAEIAVTVKDDERTYTQKFLDYTYEINETHRECIKKTIEEFHGEVEDVKLRITLSV